MLIFYHWFWFVLSSIFAGLWLWILLHQYGEKKKNLPLVSTDQNYINAEDALKATYHLHEKKKDWDWKDLPWDLNQVLTLNLLIESKISFLDFCSGNRCG